MIYYSKGNIDTFNPSCGIGVWGMECADKLITLLAIVVEIVVSVIEIQCDSGGLKLGGCIRGCKLIRFDEA